MPRSVIGNIKKLKKELKKHSGKEMYQMDLILLIENTIGVGEVSARSYIRDLLVREIISHGKNKHLFKVM